METKIQKILERETKGIDINNNTRHKLIFSYDEVEGMLNEIVGWNEEREKEYDKKLKPKDRIICGDIE